MARKMAPRSRLGTAYSLVFVSHVVSVASYGHGSREIKPGLLLVLAGCGLKYSKIEYQQPLKWSISLR